MPALDDDTMAAAGPAEREDAALVEALRRGDAAAFTALVERYHRSLVHVALTYVRDRGVAEEVAQETWLGILHGIDRFESRSSLKTWMFRILANRARTRAVRERRSVPFSSLEGAGEDAGESAVDPSRFLPADDPRWPGHWAAAPSDWRTLPEERLLARETLGFLGDAIEDLPPRQREAITLRDVEGFSAEEAATVLGVSADNQRVLLHRARSKVRRALEGYLDEEVAA